VSAADSGGCSEVHLVMCEDGSGDSREGAGEFGGREMGERGSSSVSCMSVLVTVSMPSLDFNSVFSCWSDALSSWSCVFTAWSLEFSSRMCCLSSLIWFSVTSMSSVCAFFLSLAVCAATRFFNFLLISLSSGLKWSKFALFLTGHSSSSCLMSKAKISSGETEGAGLLLPTTVAIGLDVGMGMAMLDISVVAGRTALLLGIKAGGVEVMIVLLRAWGLDVITL